ncbi:DUF1801 domain-containing protein [Rhodohalobacter sulfatireducens]|uniref:DUF1801 domain-containing protein n=1 Tax=Rhodohalobacter sulfatireducens TaxID=2911366 RepID=A0ABS9KG89_9BACT|nr:DUF1801 domain-containing protein [Rhodohalobacter sulfatireducens]MCG2589883.1 DUF1801 domain-containing protein [Rhodohalobacter sulfatireducens]
MEAADRYFSALKSPQKEICLTLRGIIFRQIPSVHEEMKWGVPAYAGGKFYIVALKDHVNLGFSLKDLSREKQRMLKGSGKTMKHLEYYTLDDIEELTIKDLLKSVLHD